MKDDWLTIPLAPNYEINSELICRNKKRNRIVKPSFRFGKRRYSLYCAGKEVNRSAQFWRNTAEEALLDEPEFLPVPSLGGKYEINRHGVLRNATSHKIKTLVNGRCYGMTDVHGAQITRSRNNLLLEVFGEPSADHQLPMPVICSKGNQRFYFDNKRKCAHFLADNLFYAVNYVWHRLCSRVDEFHGWTITYLDSDANFYNKELSYEARRMRTLDKKAGLTC